MGVAFVANVSHSPEPNSEAVFRFVGADLALVVTQALLSAIRRTTSAKPDSHPEPSSDRGSGPDPGPGPGPGPDLDPGRRVVVLGSDLIGASALVSPSALREVAVEVPKVHTNP